LTRNLTRSARTVFLIAMAIFLLAVAHSWFHVVGPDAQMPPAGVPADLAPGTSRGEYLARAADCAACHTAQDGGLPYAGGRAFKLPFGTIYSTNLTPDADTGIGRMSDAAFVAAVRQGIGLHGRLYPAMPYPTYSRMSREDVLAIKHYLMTLAPVHQATPANALSFPFNQRWGMWFWNLAFFRERRFAPAAEHDATWNRGAYLAGPLGHCAECHTPRNFAFALKDSRAFAGELTDGWKAYNITSDKADGIGAWSDAQLSAYLRSGHAPGRSSAAGPMAEVVQNSTQYLTASDMKALIGYLRSLPAQSGGQSGGVVDLAPKPAVASNAVLPADSATTGNARGLRLFEGDCAGCHQWNGVGRQSDHAALTGSRAVNDPSGVAIVQILLHGADPTIAGRKQVMPGFGATYSDADIAAVANYVLGHFGAKTGTVTAAQVAEQRLK
jgi:mono/diheme cytochrome c family protein